MITKTEARRKCYQIGNFSQPILPAFLSVEGENPLVWPEIDTRFSFPSVRVLFVVLKNPPVPAVVKMMKHDKGKAVQRL